MTWAFTASQAETVKLWSTMDTRDAEKGMFFFPLMYGDSGTAPYLPGANKWKGVIRAITDFQGKQGDRVTVPHVPRLTGAPVMGNTQLRGTGAAQSIQSQNVFFDHFAKQLTSDGPLSDSRALLKFLDVARPSLKDWYRRTVEEAMAIAAFGLTTWNNTGVFDNWYAGLPGLANSVFLNPVNAYGSTEITYAGDATSDATIDSGDALTAQLLSKVSTVIREDRAIPLEPVMFNGKERYIFLTQARGIEQLMYDEDFREAHTRVIADASNPLTMREPLEFDKFLIMEYPKCPNPAANVGRSLVLGADALLYAKVKDMDYFQDPADDAKRRTALSITAAAGVTGNFIDSIRRNAHAVDHYVRT